MDATRGAEREGWPRVLLAVVGAGIAFPIWLVGPYGVGPFALGAFGTSGLFASAYPTTLEFVRWAGAGIMAGLVAGCIAPQRRWVIVPPLLVLLEIGWAGFIFLVAGAGDIARPPGTFQGMAAGVVLGVAAVVACLPTVRPSRRVGMIVLAAVVLAAVPVISAWRGRDDIIAMRERVFPALTKLLRDDVLVNPGPVQWIEVRRQLSEQGQLYVYAYGEMRQPRAQIALDWRDRGRWTGGPDNLQGFPADGLQIQVREPIPSRIWDLIAAPPTGRPALTSRDVREMLTSIGVSSQLVERADLRTRPDSANQYAVATYHGISYDFDWHTLVAYEFRRMEFPSSSVLITCSGTHSASAP
jgi:hypothetical protein